jgi:hypothetical protein
MIRTPPPALQERFDALCNTPSDINEHLPLLRDLARQCEHVTEFGMRGGVSTTALLAGQPESLISWDINPVAVVHQNNADLISMQGRTFFQPRVGDTLKIRIEPTDMLFIDSLHTYAQLRAELERHCDPEDRLVRKFLVFHDTTTFGQKGEDGTEPGLRAAIRFLQKEFAFPLWWLAHDLKNNNGLIVLEHVQP